MIQINRKKWSDVLFFCLMMAIPLIQMLIFYVGVNFNSLSLMFKSYDIETGDFSIVYFDNFIKAFGEFKNNPLLSVSFKNSLIVSLCLIIISFPIGLLFSYAIFKKCFAHNIFKVVLFIPQIVSVIVMTTMFNYFVEKAIPELAKILFGKEMMGLFSETETAFPTLIFYTIWTSFGSSMLMYVGAMTSIDNSILEAANLDGTSPIQEFVYIILPSIFSTISVFLNITIVGIFSQQINLFSFFGTRAETNLYTIGYYLYRETQLATTYDYPYLATLGFLFTIVATIISFTARHLMAKYGPSEE